MPDLDARLDVLADEGDTAAVFAVWAARIADARGDTDEAERWAAIAAADHGRLF